MKQLFLSFYRKLSETDMRFERYLLKQIDWNNRLTAITGARGTGKTTLLLQHIKEMYGNNPEDILFVSLDNIYFSNNNLYTLANDFFTYGVENCILMKCINIPIGLRRSKIFMMIFPN
jgi:uncharacterized protein